MEELNKKVSGLRKMMSEMKEELYAIVNPDLVALDEYTKGLYLKVLCTVVQYENDPSDMQTLYLKRIVKGIGVDEPLEEYMRKALEISEVDLQEFISFMKENPTRYYFTLEGLVLLSMGSHEKNNYEYLAELIELSGVTKKELKCLSLIAESILRQESPYYEEAKKSMTESLGNLCFAPYIENYYVGVIIDTQDEKYYSAPDRETEQSIEYPESFTARYVTFHNLNIEITHDLKFNGCETVTFKNCRLHNSEADALKFKGIGNLQFEQCEFVDFGKHVAWIDDVNETRITNCKFSNCGSRFYCNWYGAFPAGMFMLGEVSSVKSFIFTDNNVLNCYVKIDVDSYCDCDSGLLLHIDGYNSTIKWVIRDNAFVGCRYIEGKERCYIKKCFIDKINESDSNVECLNNKCIGEVIKIFR